VWAGSRFAAAAILHCFSQRQLTHHRRPPSRPPTLAASHATALFFLLYFGVSCMLVLFLPARALAVISCCDHSCPQHHQLVSLSSPTPLEQTNSCYSVFTAIKSCRHYLAVVVWPSPTIRTASAVHYTHRATLTSYRSHQTQVSIPPFQGSGEVNPYL